MACLVLAKSFPEDLRMSYNSTCSAHQNCRLSLRRGSKFTTACSLQHRTDRGGDLFLLIIYLCPVQVFILYLITLKKYKHIVVFYLKRLFNSILKWDPKEMLTTGDLFYMEESAAWLQNLVIIRFFLIFQCSTHNCQIFYDFVTLL